jgi:hypothetical protein
MACPRRSIGEPTSLRLSLICDTGFLRTQILASLCLSCPSSPIYYLGALHTACESRGGDVELELEGAAGWASHRGGCDQGAL